MQVIDTPHAVNMMALNLHRAAGSRLSAARGAVQVEFHHLHCVRRVEGEGAAVGQVSR